MEHTRFKSHKRTIKRHDPLSINVSVVSINTGTKKCVLSCRSAISTRGLGEVGDAAPAEVGQGARLPVSADGALRSGESVAAAVRATDSADTVLPDASPNEEFQNRSATGDESAPDDRRTLTAAFVQFALGIFASLIATTVEDLRFGAAAAAVGLWALAAANPLLGRHKSFVCTISRAIAEAGIALDLALICIYSGVAVAVNYGSSERVAGIALLARLWHGRFEGAERSVSILVVLALAVAVAVTSSTRRDRFIPAIDRLRLLRRLIHGFAMIAFVLSTVAVELPKRIQTFADQRRGAIELQHKEEQTAKEEGDRRAIVARRAEERAERIQRLEAVYVGLTAAFESIAANTLMMQSVREVAVRAARNPEVRLMRELAREGAAIDPEDRVEGKLEKRLRSDFKPGSADLDRAAAAASHLARLENWKSPRQVQARELTTELLSVLLDDSKLNVLRDDKVLGPAFDAVNEQLVAKVFDGQYAAFRNMLRRGPDYSANTIWSVDSSLESRDKQRFKRAIDSMTDHLDRLVAIDTNNVGGLTGAIVRVPDDIRLPNDGRVTDRGEFDFVVPREEDRGWSFWDVLREVGERAPKL
jgi:hypothetical protein